MQGSNPGRIFTQYFAAGCEYEKVIVFLNYKFTFKDKIICYDFKNENYDPAQTWIYEAVTRATKSIKFLVQENGEYAQQIYDCLNNRINELKKLEK